MTAEHTKALGAVIRMEREAREWTRAVMVAKMPSGIGEQTLLTYEHGIREMTVIRFLEIAAVLEVGPTELLEAALVEGRQPEMRDICVDVRAMVASVEPVVGALRNWARHWADQGDDRAVISSRMIYAFAAVVGCEPRKLALALLEVAYTEAD